MKKYLSILLAVFLVMLCGCNKQSVSSGDESDTSIPVEYIYEDSDVSSSDTSSQTASENTSSQDNTSSSSSTSSKKETTKLYEETNSNIEVPELKIPGISGNNSNSNNNNSNTNTSTPSNTDDRKTFYTPIGEFYEDSISYYKYAINGTPTDWFTEDDMIHITLKNGNRYVLINSNSGEIVKDVALSGRPAQMLNLGDEIWISYPDLKCIKKHDKATLSVKATLDFDTEISSFDVCNDYLVYAEDDQGVKAYRCKLATGEKKEFTPVIGFYFSEANVIINEDLRVVYICESNSTGSAVYCYDLDTMTLKSQFRKDNYGYTNSKRRSFLRDGSLFWGEFKLDASNVSNIQAQYSAQYSASMLHIDDYFVCTTRGIFLKDTYDMLIAADSTLELAAITSSGNIIVGDRTNLYILLG